ncbi:MAG TPA: hypothetical protein VGR43_02395 [Dehalococcoidia bacterium]|nr:hypothetical protein [Dehalococcoidia bacterium]
MTKIENVRGKSAKQHYVDAAGAWLPGASSIADLLGPVGGLGYWGFQVGRSGEVDDYWAYLKGLGEAGTCAHAAVNGYVRGEKLDFSMFTGQEMAIAEGCLKKYIAWEKQHTVKHIYAERPLVSETYKFGGQLDLYAQVDDLYTIIDLKSSDDARDQHRVQTAGYRQLVLEAGDPVDQLIVLPLGRDPKEPMHKPWQTTTEMDDYWAIFKHLLGIYSIQSSLKKSNKRSGARIEAAEIEQNKGLLAAIEAREVGKVIPFPLKGDASA